MLNELLDEYKDCTEDQKVKLVNEFINRLWKSEYTYKTYKKYYTYFVNEELLNFRDDLIELFNKYNMVEFSVCRSFYDKQLNSFDYIKIHINNMYGYLTDKNVYLSKDYYKLLLTPKHEYFSVINKLKNGEIVDCKEIKNRITSAFSEAQKIKEKTINRKQDITWKEFKKLIETYIERLFKNYIPLHEYEIKNGWEMQVNVDGWSEDNYIVKYFCKSLTGYLRNYVRDCKPKDSKKKKCCMVCKLPIENTGNKKSYCEKCAYEKEKIRKREWKKNRKMVAK